MGFISLGLITSLASASPYHRAMVFSGKSNNTALFLGMFDAATDAGQPPDVVIGSCGGSIGAALIHLDEDRTSRLDFLKSQDYYKQLRDLPITTMNGVEIWKLLQRENTVARENRRPGQTFRTVLTDWFQVAFAQVGNLFDHLSKFDVPFKNSGTHIVIISAQTLFPDPVDDQRFPAEKKLFREVFFADKAMLPLLQQLPSPVGKDFPESAVAFDTLAWTPSTVMQAIRASISDPLYIGPSHMDGETYFTGAIDLNPLPLAHILADAVITTYPSSFDALVETPIIQGVFDFNPNHLVAKSMQAGANAWVDFTDEAFPNLSPRGKLQLWASIQKMDLRSFLKIQSYIPRSYDEYVDAVEAQYRYGYVRTREALSRPPGDASHVRRPSRRFL